MSLRSRLRSVGPTTQQQPSALYHTLSAAQKLAIQWLLRLIKTRNKCETRFSRDEFGCHSRFAIPISVTQSGSLSCFWFTIWSWLVCLMAPLRSLYALNKDRQCLISNEVLDWKLLTINCQGRLPLPQFSMGFERPTATHLPADPDKSGQWLSPPRTLQVC